MKMSLCIDAGLRKKKSIKHRDKIQKLQEIPVESLTKVKPPLKYFATDKTLSIGSGSNGTSVFVGIMEDGSKVAVKRMLKYSCEAPAENEKKILSLIDTKKSPFIVGYRHFFKDSTFVYLAVDLCEETLKEYVSFQSTEYLQQHGRRMIKEIFTGLDFLHNQGVLHRDLKPSNVLVDVDGHMRLADFGISRILNDDETTHLTDAKGTYGWMAREVIETIGEGGIVHLKKKSDVQVGGMVAHFILTKGGHPFGDTYDRMANIVKGNPVHLDNIDDRDDRSFISWLISHNIKDRPYAHVALETLKNLSNERRKEATINPPFNEFNEGHVPSDHLCPVLPHKADETNVLRSKNIMKKRNMEPSFDDDYHGYTSPEVTIQGTQVIALVDYNPGQTDFLAFKKGDIGRLIEKADTGFWFVELNGYEGWVPAIYWEEMKEGCNSNTPGVISLLDLWNPGLENEWFRGEMTREQCEVMFQESGGKHLDFIIRASVRRVGSYVLSIQFANKIHHFPIEKLLSGKFVIGRKIFDNLSQILTYYRVHPLFFTDSEKPVSVGKPL